MWPFDALSGSDDRTATILLLTGDQSAEQLRSLGRHVADAIEETYSIEVVERTHLEVGAEIGDTAVLHEQAYDDRRGQYDAAQLAPVAIPTDTTHGIAITDVDLFIDRRDYTLGTALIDDGAALVSTNRLVDDHELITRDDAARVRKEAIKTLGWTFTEEQCSNLDCILGFAPRPDELDEQPERLCEECRRSI